MTHRRNLYKRRTPSINWSKVPRHLIIDEAMYLAIVEALQRLNVNQYSDEYCTVIAKIVGRQLSVGLNEEPVRLIREGTYFDTLDRFSAQ